MMDALGIKKAIVAVSGSLITTKSHPTAAPATSGIGVDQYHFVTETG